MIKNFLLFAEDPGAINLIIDLPSQFNQFNIKFEIIANSFASDMLTKYKIKHEFIDTKNDLKNYLYKNKFLNFLIGTSENKESLGLFLIEYALNQRIKCIGLVDMAVNYENRFRGYSNDPLKYKPDKIISTDELTRNALIKIGMNSNDVLTCDHPQIERIKDKKKSFSKESMSINSINQKWLFVSENFDLLNPSESFYNKEYLFSGRGNTQWRTGIILEEILDALKIVSPKQKLTVRLHPKNNKDQFSKWEDEIRFDEIIDPLKSVLSSDIILGMSSNLLVESMICQKPVLSILPRFIEKKWLSELNSNLIKTVFNRFDLIESLRCLAEGKYDAFKKYDAEKTSNSLFQVVLALTGINSI